MSYQLIMVSISQIDFTDTRFCHRYRLPKDSFHNSLVCPLVLAGKEPPYRIVSGFRRAASLKKLQQSFSFQAMLAAGEESEKDLFLQSLQWNYSAKLQDLDRARLVALATETFGLTSNETIAALAPFFEETWHAKLLDRFHKLSKMPDFFCDYLFENNLGMKFAQPVLDWETADLHFLVTEILPCFHLTSSEIKSFAGLAEELMRIEEKKLQSLMEAVSWRQWVIPEEGKAKEAAKNLLAAMWQRRFPVLNQLSARVETFSKQLELGPKMFFSVPEGMEKDYFSLEIHFQDREDLEKSLRRLSENLPAWNGIENLLDLEA